MAATAMAGATVATVATGTARGLLMLRLSPDTAMAATAVDTATDMAVAMDTTARGLLMPSLRLMPRLSPATAATAMAATAMVATDMAVATTARGRLRLSLATAMAVMAVDTAAMVATGATAMVATARGLPSLATAMVATGAT